MKRQRGSDTLLRVLIVMDAFILGGCLALYLTRRLLLTIFERLVTAPAQAEILNVLDHLLPYYVWYGLALMAAMLLTLAALLWRRGLSLPRLGPEG